MGQMVEERCRHFGIVEQSSGRADEPDVKDATVERYYYDSHVQLRQHLADFGPASNFGRRLTP